jgi:uncharacterized membrane protein
MASGSWKRDFASGLIVLVPLLITVYVLAYIYGFIAGSPFTTAVIDAELLARLNLPNGQSYVTFARVIVTLVVFVVMVFSIGYLMRTALGDLVERFLDNVMNRVPLLRVVYNASKMAVETALSGTDELQEPVKLEPWNGMRMTAFKTGKSTEDGRDVVFMPTAPNITTGFVLEVDPEDYEETDERVEDALTRILSAGFGENQDDKTLAMALGDSEDGESPPADDD